MQVSLEIVPRSPADLERAAELGRAFPAIGAVNVPDLLRFPLRSWEACADLRADPAIADRFRLIPHLRAIDFDPNAPFPLGSALRAAGITRVLAIAGDPPQDMARRVYPATTVEFIRKLKSELPGIEVFAAFDPYRSNIRYELDYVKAKLDAGADGFMSQPFFDLRLLEIYAEYLEGQRVYWGIAPVGSAKSRNYWEARNRAIFPRAFRPTLDWNIEFGRMVLDFCARAGFDLYLMPIKTDLEAYLKGLFD
jgi:methylenetetrahydrofolate reductase (NADPH)